MLLCLDRDANTCSTVGILHTEIIFSESQKDSESGTVLEKENALCITGISIDLIEDKLLIF